MSANFKNAMPTGDTSTPVKTASVNPTRAPLAAKADTELYRLSLAVDGYTRWSELKHIVPCSHEWVRQRELMGRFPKRVQLGGPRCVGWPNRELLRWLESPNDYRAAGTPVPSVDAPEQAEPPAARRKRAAVSLASTSAEA